MSTNRAPVHTALKILGFIFRCMAWLLGGMVVTYLVLIAWSLTFGYYILTFYLPNGMYLNRNYNFRDGWTTIDLLRTSDDKLLERGLEWICFNDRSISGNVFETNEMERKWTQYGYAQENLFIYVDANRERPATKDAYETAMREAGMWATQKNCYCRKDFGPEIFFSRLFLGMTEKECGPSGGTLD